MGMNNMHRNYGWSHFSVKHLFSLFFLNDMDSVLAGTLRNKSQWLCSTMFPMDGSYRAGAGTLVLTEIVLWKSWSWKVWLGLRRSVGLRPFKPLDIMLCKQNCWCEGTSFILRYPYQGPRSGEWRTSLEKWFSHQRVLDNELQASILDQKKYAIIYLLQECKTDICKK